MSMLDILNTRMTELDTLQKSLEERLGDTRLDDTERGIVLGRLVQIHAERKTYGKLFDVLIPD